MRIFRLVRSRWTVWLRARVLAGISREYLTALEENRHARGQLDAVRRSVAALREIATGLEPGHPGHADLDLPAWEGLAEQWTRTVHLTGEKIRLLRRLVEATLPPEEEAP